MLNRLIVSVAASTMCVALAEVRAESLPDSAQVPALNVGDSWTYRYFDNWKGQPGGSTTQEVTSVSEKEVTLDVKRLTDGQVLRKLRWSSGLNPVTRGHMEFAPSFPRYAFPLEAGKTWKEDVTAQNPANNRSWRYNVQGKVVGWEKVKVPAGEFDALRVDVEALYHGNEVGRTGGSGRSIETVWYAPAAKSYVKYEYQDTDWNGKVFNRDSLELTTYKVK